MQNEYGQGSSHAVGGSKVPQKAQEKVPKSLEETLPNKVDMATFQYFFIILPILTLTSRSMTPAPELVARPTP